MNHVHASAMTAIMTFLMVIIVGAFWRLIALRLAHTPVGKAMGFMY